MKEEIKHTEKKGMSTGMYVMIGLLIIFVVTTGVLGIKVLKSDSIVDA